MALQSNNENVREKLKVLVYVEVITKPSMIWLFNKYLKLQKKKQDKMRKSQKVAPMGKAAED